ncbi:MAG: hypothetical protein M1114_00915 [Candidatus Dependentiae bacterium]|nr:hypothetical protein [Candidatus Dependentiae bacterium]
MLKKINFLFLFVIVIPIFAAEEFMGTMKKISTWEDAGEFCGTIVAYAATAPCFNSSTFAIDSGDSNLPVCYVEKKEQYDWGPGYGMCRLIKALAVHSCCALTTHVLEEHGPISMRKATAKECLIILNAINSKQANFAYVVGGYNAGKDEEIRAALERQSK